MLELKIEGKEFFNDETQEFINIKPVVLRLEPSPVFIFKWEAKWKKPFLVDNKKTVEELLDYIRCMTINQNVNNDVYLALEPKDIDAITEYIKEDQTATTFNARNSAPSRRVVTSELVYFWMSQYNIPMECQKWHFSRLMTLIRIANIENSPPSKMSTASIMSQNQALNAARRKAMRTKG